MMFQLMKLGQKILGKALFGHLMKQEFNLKSMENFCILNKQCFICQEARTEGCPFLHRYRNAPFASKVYLKRFSRKIDFSKM